RPDRRGRAREAGVRWPQFAARGSIRATRLQIAFAQVGDKCVVRSFSEQVCGRECHRVHGFGFAVDAVGRGFPGVRPHAADLHHPPQMATQVAWHTGVTRRHSVADSYDVTWSEAARSCWCEWRRKPDCLRTLGGVEETLLRGELLDRPQPPLVIA